MTSTKPLPQAGSPVPAATRGPITLQMLQLYARASGDYNPIHVDDAAAKKAGLPGIIAHGMLSAGFLATLATEAMQPWEGEWKLSSFQSRFKAMTLLGETVTLSGVFKSVEKDQVCLELAAKNSKGEATTLAHAEFRRR